MLLAVRLGILALEKDESDKLQIETLNEIQSIHAANSYGFDISILLSRELEQDTTTFRHLLKFLG